MGACDFWTQAQGKTAAEAFDKAVEEARYECGHGGYTGTIAEKRGFVMVTVPAGKDPGQHAQDLYDANDKRVIDKWGPACCVALGNGNYLFFGLASC